MVPALLNHQRPQALSYGGLNHLEQTIDLYQPVFDRPEQSPSKSEQLLIYVHGGAWKVGDKADTYSLGLIENLSTRFPHATSIASINYRLSKENDVSTRPIRHPSHNSDVAKAINFLVGLPELDQVKSIYLIGHSVGAFICLSICGLLQSPYLSRIESPSKITGLVLLDGIYSLPDLLVEYPTYQDFVRNAFGNDLNFDHLRFVSPLYWTLSTEARNLTVTPDVLIIHSRQDQLLTSHQSRLLKVRLDGFQMMGRVEMDLDTVKGEHDPLLKSPELTERIHAFVARSS